jgi:hypothetical protein
MPPPATPTRSETSHRGAGNHSGASRAEENLLETVVQTVPTSRPVICKQTDVAEGVIDAAAQGTHDHDRGRISLQGAAQRQLEVGLILVARVPQDLSFRVRGRPPSDGIRGIQVTDQNVGNQAQRTRVSGTAVGADDEVARLKQAPGSGQIRQDTVGEYQDCTGFMKAREGTCLCLRKWVPEGKRNPPSAEDDSAMMFPPPA